VLDRQDGPVIVASHSYGGQIITALGVDAPGPRATPGLCLSVAGNACRAADDVAGQLGEQVVVVAGVASQCDECLVGGHPEPSAMPGCLLGQDAALVWPGH